MRLKKIAIIFLWLSFVFCKKQVVFAACCSGGCGTSDTCEFINTVTKAGSFFPDCDQVTTIDCKTGTAETYVPKTYSTWSPVGSSTTVCKNDCKTVPGYTSGTVLITETKTVYCGDCPEETGPGSGTTTPTATPNSSWINGQIQEDINATLIGDVCTQRDDAFLAIQNIVVSASNADGTKTYKAKLYSLNTSFGINTLTPGLDYQVSIDVSKQTGSDKYVCSCPAPISYWNPYYCQYTGISSPNQYVNFYLKKQSLSNNSWFQVFGSNVFANFEIESNIPYNACSIANNCQAAILAPMPNSNNLTNSGFPIIGSNATAYVRSSSSISSYHTFIHLPERLENNNSYGLSTSLSPLNFDYFYNLAEKSTEKIGNGEDLEPRFAEFAPAENGEVRFIKVNGNVNIDENQGFFLNSNQKLVVFVEGNLILDDSNPDDWNRKITSVAEGGFLAFIVKGDILISAEVGYDLDPDNPSVPAVSVASSNVEGVFIADGTLTIENKVTVGEVPPDRKFIGAGTFVAWGDVKLDRTFENDGNGAILNNNQAVENFVYRPDFLVNWPVKLKNSLSTWKEVDPQLIQESTTENTEEETENDSSDGSSGPVVKLTPPPPPPED